MENKGVASGWGERGLSHYLLVYMERALGLNLRATCDFPFSPTSTVWNLLPLLSGSLEEKLLLATNRYRHVMEKSETAGCHGQP